MKESGKMDRVHKEADKILKRELGDEWGGWTYEVLRSGGSYGYTNTYLYFSANHEQFSSSAKTEVMLELAKLDLQKGTTIPELMLKCCQFFPKKEALEKLVELGKQTQSDREVAKSVLKFQNRNGNSCLTVCFDIATEYRNRTDEYPSGPMLREIEQSCFYLIDLIKCFNLDMKNILNHTAKNGNTLFFYASIFSETVTRKLLEENVQVNSVDSLFITPFFRVRIILVSKIRYFAVTHISE